jgi:tRNA pseudouridine synthase 10
MDNLDSYLKLMLDISNKYDYSTFVVGAKLKPSIIDRDDYIRSKYRFIGIDSIKSEITKELAKKFSKQTQKIIDSLNPDLTLTINTKDESCEIHSKPIVLQGRYTKLKRGFPQKQKSCFNCSGNGCTVCNLHGFSDYNSVEGQISKIFFELFGGTTAKFTWIGGEDISSLVLGSGRPFYTKIHHPLKRNLILPPKITSEFVTIHNCRIIPELPKIPPKFNSMIEIKILTGNEINSQNLKKLKELCGIVIVYDKSGKRSEKIISYLKYKKTGDHSFTLFIKADGGLPVKRFIESDEVIPGVSQILSNQCKCVEFNFLEINIK